MSNSEKKIEVSLNMNLENNITVKEKSEKPTVKQYRRAASLILLVTIIGFMSYALIQNYIFRKDCGIDFTARGTGMSPNYKDGDKVCVEEVGNSTELNRGDVVIVDLNPNDIIMKRIIGLPGDEVSLIKGELHINGSKLSETSYLSPETETYKNIDQVDKEEELVESKLEANQYYILGDNRAESKKDSRTIGVVSRDKIKYIILKKVN